MSDLNKSFHLTPEAHRYIVDHAVPMRPCRWHST